MENITLLSDPPSPPTALLFLRPLSALSALFTLEVFISIVSRPSVWIAGLACWVAICTALRRRFERGMLARYRYTGRESLAHMTNDEALAILRELATFEFPMLSTLALQFALFKTYGCEGISTLLVQTRQLWHPSTAAKRYEDTTVLFGEFMLNPPTSARHIAAIARMNTLHAPYIASGKIQLEDLVYTLAVCILQPIRFYRLYEWRQPNELDVAGLATAWKCIADGMAVDYQSVLGKSRWGDGLEFYEDIKAWAARYEAENLRFSPQNQKLGDALLDMMLFHVPGWMKGFAQGAIFALMGDRVREAFGFPEPEILPAAFIFTALSLRRVFLRYFSLPRMSPVPNFSNPDPKTGRIHHFAYLRRPFYVPATLWRRWGPEALLTRALGGTVPGDGSYVPQGFLVPEVGPEDKRNVGVEVMKRHEERMAGDDRRGACPFAF